MKDITWKLGRGRALGPAPFIVAGIVNVTPDSFFDGGKHDEAVPALTHARQLLDEGAHILDIGGESTRPYADPVSLEQELERVVPVIRELCADPEVVVSVDTYKAEVARQALEAGALIVNDVSAFRYDPELLDVVAEYKPGYVLMHSLGRPEEMQDAPSYGNVVDEIVAFFAERLDKLTKAGVPINNIVLDPGIGFGKLLEHNLEILRNVSRFSDEFGLPVYMGLSNKSLWQGLLGLEVHERANANQAATAVLACKGVGIHRVHDVRKTIETLTIARELA